MLPFPSYSSTSCHHMMLQKSNNPRHLTLYKSKHQSLGGLTFNYCKLSYGWQTILSSSLHHHKLSSWWFLVMLIKLDHFPPPTFSFSLKMKKKCLKTSPASNNFTKKPTFKIFSAKGADPWHFCEMHFPSQPSTRRYENSLHLALVFDFPLPNFCPLSLEGRKPGFNVVDFWEEGMKGEWCVFWILKLGILMQSSHNFVKISILLLLIRT